MGANPASCAKLHAPTVPSARSDDSAVCLATGRPELVAPPAFGLQALAKHFRVHEDCGGGGGLLAGPAHSALGDSQTLARVVKSACARPGQEGNTRGRGL